MALKRKQIHPYYAGFSVSVALKQCTVTRHNCTAAPAVSLRQMTRGRVRLGQLRKLQRAPSKVWEQLICQRPYEPLISWPAPVFGSPGVWWAPPQFSHHPHKLRRGLGDPHSSRMIDRATARRKGSCDEREKEGSVHPCPLCAFNYLPSCLARPCPHNRVLTGAVSRQH